MEELSTSVASPHFGIADTSSTDCDIRVVYERIRKDLSAMPEIQIRQSNNETQNQSCRGESAESRYPSYALEEIKLLKKLQSELLRAPNSTNIIHSLKENLSEAPRDIRNNQSCKGESAESKYPSYALEEIKLLKKLQSELLRPPNSTNIIYSSKENVSKARRDIILEANDSGIELEEVQAHCDSDPKDCEILWVKESKISQSGSEPPVMRVVTDGDLEARRNKTQKEQAKEKEKERNQNVKNKFPTNCNVYQSSPTSLSQDLKRRSSAQIENTTSCDATADNRKTRSVTARESNPNKSTLERKIYEHCCDICFKMFRTPMDRFRHVIIHADQRPFHCEFCPYNYKYRSHLSRHVRKAHRK